MNVRITQIWPDIYTIVTYPLTTFIEALWKYKLRDAVNRCKEVTDAERSESPNGSSSQTVGRIRSGPSQSSTASAKPKMLWAKRLRETPAPQYLELMAVAERALNFAHTGAARVLVRGLMTKLWTGSALVDGYLPMFSPALQFVGSRMTEPAFPLSVWPTHPKSGKPLVASKRTQELTYGNAHFLVCTRALSSSPTQY